MDVQKIEKNILKFWEKDKIFEKSVENRKKAKAFVFYEGPPTANAKPGVHSVLARIFKDIICRYKTMQGYRVVRKAGWDAHGLPVELEIEKELGFKQKRDIEKYGIARFNRKCKESVWKYKSDWEDITKKIGFWLDMNNPYITYERPYIEILWWIIKRVWEKGLLFQDFKVVPYCARCGTGLSSHEVALGYKNIKEPSIFLKFLVANSKLQIANRKIKDNKQLAISNKPTYLLVWTTTPWTLPGNVAIAVHPDIDYVVVEHKGENLILAKERLGVLDGDYGVVKEFRGKDLLGVEYIPLFEFVKPDKKAYFVISGDFVSVEEGTGLVHIAPAFGEEDMQVGKKNDLPVLISVGEDGKFKDEIKPWRGEWVKDADPKIIQYLFSRKILYKEEPYEHDYPFCWRCESPLLYLAKKSWFIKMTKVKEDLIRNNKKINWVPSHLQEGRFGEWLREVKDWALSRERYWGTPLPLWKCKACDHEEVIGSTKDLFAQTYTTNTYFTLRHGEADSNVKEYLSSLPEPKINHLTAKGKSSVRKLIPRLKKEKIDLIVVSPLARTQETAKIIADFLHIPVKIDHGLREIETGLLNGGSIDAYRNFFGDVSKLFSKRPIGGENLKDVRVRMIKSIRSIDKKYKNKNILLISHGDPIWMLGGLMEGMGQEEFIKHKSRLSSKTAELKKLVYTFLPYNEECELDFHRPFIDEVEFICKKCSGSMRRVADLIDVWFDSGAMPFAQSGKPDFASSFASPSSNTTKGHGKASADRQIKNLKLKIKNHEILFPADFICEAMDQTRGWFYTLLAISTLLGLGPSFKNVISLGLVLDKKGEKMSKSKGNVVDPWEIIAKYGADATRWYFFTVNKPGEVKKFDEADVAERQRRFIGTLYNTYRFFETYASKKQFPISNPKSPVGDLGSPLRDFQFPKNVLDKWIISRLHELIDFVTKSLDEYDITSAAREIEKFVDGFSNWYLRRSRRRFQRPENKEEKLQAEQTLAFVMLEFSRIIAPFTPFLSEEIYKRVKSIPPSPRLRRTSKGASPQRGEARPDEYLGGRNSVHLCNWPKAQKRLINPELNKQMDIVRRIVALGLRVRAHEGMRVRQPLARLEVMIPASEQAPYNNKLYTRQARYGAGKNQWLHGFIDLIKEELNVKEVRFVKEVNKKFVKEKDVGVEVALDTWLTPQLKEEGAVREIVRNIQDMRKEAGYQPDWPAQLCLFTKDPLQNMIQRWEKFIKHETNTKSIIFESIPKMAFDVKKETTIDGEVVAISIRKL